MGHPDLAVVTGAFGYTGGYVARRLLDQGIRVRTLTRRTDRREASRFVMELAPLDFSDPDGLRRFPVFPVHGSGDYPVQPVHSEDVAAQAVEAGSQSDSSVADAAGPQTFSFEELIRLLASAMGVRARFMHTSPSVGFALTRLVGLIMRDVVLTRDEVAGLMAGLLASKSPPTGTTRVGDWLQDNADSLGETYVSELRRNWGQVAP